MDATTGSAVTSKAQRNTIIAFLSTAAAAQDNYLIIDHDNDCHWVFKFYSGARGKAVTRAM